MARIAGIDLPKNKRGVIGLKFKIGLMMSRMPSVLSLMMSTRSKALFVLKFR